MIILLIVLLSWVYLMGVFATYKVMTQFQMDEYPWYVTIPIALLWPVIETYAMLLELIELIKVCI